MKAVSISNHDEVINKLDSYTLSDIDGYGEDKLEDTKHHITDIYNLTKQLSNTDVSSNIAKLSKFADTHATSLVKSTKGLGLAMRVSKFIGKYERMEDKLVQLEDGVRAQENNLRVMVDSLGDNYEVLKQQKDEFERQGEELEIYKEYLISQDIPDEVRIQAVSQRLNKLTTFYNVANISIEQTKTLLIQTREYQYQLKETLDTVVPIVKMQLIGVLANRYNKEADRLIKVLRDLGSEVIVATSNDILESAKNLKENAATDIVSVEALKESSKILAEAVKQLYKRQNQIQANSSGKIMGDNLLLEELLESVKEKENLRNV